MILVMLILTKVAFCRWCRPRSDYTGAQSDLDLPCTLLAGQGFYNLFKITTSNIEIIFDHESFIIVSSFAFSGIELNSYD